MAQYDELVEALIWLLTNRVQNKINYSHGLLGDGQGRVRVAGNEDFVYARPDRFSSRSQQVFNKRVTGQDGDPIIIGELPWEPGLTQVISIDWRTYKEIGWGGDTSGFVYHGRTHIWKDAAPGLDTFPVYRRQLGDLQATASVSGTNAVDISSYSIELYGDQKQFPGTFGFPLDNAVPASTGSARMALLYWDPSSGTTGYIGVATGTTGIESESTILNRPVSLPGTIPIAYIRLRAGQASVTEFDIFDAREPFRPGIGFGTGSSQFNAALIPIADDGGFFTGSSVETALQELGGGAGVLGAAGGDLTGTYPNPTVGGIFGTPYGGETPVLGDVLIFTGSAWRPGSVDLDTYDEISFYREGVIVTGGNVDRSHIFTRPAVLEFAYIHLKDQGSTGTTATDFNINDTTIFTTQANRPQIIGGSTTKVDKSGAPDIVLVGEYDILTMDIDSAATDAADLSATVLVRRIGTTQAATTVSGVDVIEANFHGAWLESHWTFGGPDEASSLDEVLYFDGI